MFQLRQSGANVCRPGRVTSRKTWCTASVSYGSFALMAKRTESSEDSIPKEWAVAVIRCYVSPSPRNMDISANHSIDPGHPSFLHISRIARALHSYASGPWFGLQRTSALAGDGFLEHCAPLGLKFGFLPLYKFVYNRVIFLLHFDVFICISSHN